MDLTTIQNKAKELKTDAKIFFYNTTIGSNGWNPRVEKIENLEYEEPDFKEFVLCEKDKYEGKDYYTWFNGKLFFLNEEEVNILMNEYITIEKLEVEEERNYYGRKYLLDVLNDAITYF